MFRNFMNLHFVCLLSNLRSINSSPTENSHTVENKEKPFSNISLNSNLSGVTARRRFINSTKKRINYDSIISGEFKKLGWNRNSLETELVKQKDSLFLILDEIDKNLYHLPESEFYIECYENGLFSKLFTRKNNYLSNVIYFFIFSKILLEHFTFETIRKYLEKGQENNIIADKIFKVLECTKRILIFHSSLFSTLQIIKENDEIWDSYYNDEEKILFYAFFLIKCMLSNIGLAFITNMNVDTEDLYDSGLNEFGIDVFEINVFGEKIKKTTWLSTYILSHISSIFDYIENESMLKNMFMDRKINSSCITHD